MSTIVAEIPGKSRAELLRDSQAVADGVERDRRILVAHPLDVDALAAMRANHIRTLRAERARVVLLSLVLLVVAVFALYAWFKRAR